MKWTEPRGLACSLHARDRTVPKHMWLTLPDRGPSSHVGPRKGSHRREAGRGRSGRNLLVLSSRWGGPYAPCSCCPPAGSFQHPPQKTAFPCPKAKLNRGLNCVSKQGFAESALGAKESESFQKAIDTIALPFVFVKRWGVWGLLGDSAEIPDAGAS